MSSPPVPPLAARGSSTSSALTLTARRPVLLILGLIAAATVLGAIAAALMPELGPSRGPRPTLHGTPGETLAIFVTNTRSLIAPLLLTAGRWHTARITRIVGDIVVMAIVTVNPLLVGLALGRYPAELPRYLPHLALEDLALAIAASAWITRRLPRPAGDRPRGVVRCALLTLAVAALAALVEVYAVPHAS